MTYDELIDNVLSYTVRDDVPVSTMIRIAEASLRPITKHYLSEKVVTLPVVDGFAELPSDFLEMRAITGTSGITYKPISPTNADVREGEVGYYRVGDEVSFVAAATGQLEAEVQLAYWYSFPALSSTQSNWLFARYPSVYLRAVLRESYRWLKDPESAAIEDAALKEELGILGEDNRRGLQTGTIYWREPTWQ
ncbi:phage adaptor protein [Ensifer canadensis]